MSPSPVSFPKSGLASVGILLLRNEAYALRAQLPLLSVRNIFTQP